MRLLYLAAAGSMLLGCTLGDPEDEGVTSQAIETHNRLASNRLASNRLASNRLASNRLASNRLASNKLVALEDTSEILDTEEGRDVYSYIVSCALPDTYTIEADVPGAPDTAPPDTTYTCTAEHCTFSGGLGVAPRWIDHRLDKKGQAWVSACLFARVNANDTAESISMRGDNAGLAVSPEEMELYTAEEGAFYGNLFINDPDPGVEPDWHACRGEAKAACPGDVGCGAGLANRDCAQEDPANPGYTYCGFKYDGDCRDFTPSTPSGSACRVYDPELGTYDRCRGEVDHGHGHGHGHGCSRKQYREVVTTWVANN
ncbi:MAG TPA: hypothetical protein VFS15_00420 [Kofleriaceae bacterium]|nr:hypothetical protein [Kofleriaceae bacterium]